MSQFTTDEESYFIYQKALVEILPETVPNMAHRVWESLSPEDQIYLNGLVTDDLERHTDGDSRQNLVNLGLAVEIPYKSGVWYLACTKIGYHVWRYRNFKVEGPEN